MLELAEIAVTYRRLLPEPCGQLIGFAATLLLLIFYRRKLSRAMIIAIAAISVALTAWHIFLCAGDSPHFALSYAIEMTQAAIFLLLWFKSQKINSKVNGSKRK